MRFGCTAVARGLLLAWGGPGSTVAHGREREALSPTASPTTRRPWHRKITKSPTT